MAVGKDREPNDSAGSAGEPAGLADRISELELIVQEQAATIQSLLNAQMAAVGADPIGARARALGRTLVQFRGNYNRMAQPSTVKDAPNIVEGYAVGELEVVRLRDDEVARIQADFPDLIETNQARFKPFKRRIPFMGQDQHGRPAWTTKVQEIPVESLVKAAPAVG
jgi:hypothetical protein